MAALYVSISRKEKIKIDKSVKRMLKDEENLE